MLAATDRRSLGVRVPLLWTAGGAILDLLLCGVMVALKRPPESALAIFSSVKGLSLGEGTPRPVLLRVYLAVLRRWPYEPSCLVQALALLRLLRRHGDSEARLGLGVAVKGAAGPFAAHAWVEDGAGVIHGLEGSMYEKIQRPRPRGLFALQPLARGESMLDTEPMLQLRPFLGCQVENQQVILALDSSVYFGLNEVASLVWQALAEGPKNFSTLQQLIVEHFAVDDGVAAQDLKSFVASLQQHGLLANESSPS